MARKKPNRPGFKHIGIIAKAMKDKRGEYKGQAIMYRIMVER